MEITSLETALIVLRHISCQIPDKGEIEGLNGNVSDNFHQIANAITDIEKEIDEMKKAEEVRKLFSNK